MHTIVFRHINQCWRSQKKRKSVHKFLSASALQLVWLRGIYKWDWSNLGILDSWARATDDWISSSFCFRRMLLQFCAAAFLHVKMLQRESDPVHLSTVEAAPDCSASQAWRDTKVTVVVTGATALQGGPNDIMPPRCPPHWSSAGCWASRKLFLSDDKEPTLNCLFDAVYIAVITFNPAADSQSVSSVRQKNVHLGSAVVSQWFSTKMEGRANIWFVFLRAENENCPCVIIIYNSLNLFGANWAKKLILSKINLVTNTRPWCIPPSNT